MNESDLSAKLMPALNSGAHSHAVRVEDVQGSGTPDVNYFIDRAGGWIETKVIKGSYIYFERFQIPWFRRRTRATQGRYVWVLVTDFEHIMLYRASAVLDAPREPSGKWVRVKVADLGEPALTLEWMRPDWHQLTTLLADE